jgi:hypothetical protein
VILALLVLILLHQVAATWVAHRERKLLLLAALSRTPAEFEMLVRSVRRSGTMDS